MNTKTEGIVSKTNLIGCRIVVGGGCCYCGFDRTKNNFGNVAEFTVLDRK